MILLDTSGLLAALSSEEPAQPAAAAAVKRAGPPLLITPFVLAELDYLIGRRLGLEERLALLEQIGRGSYRLETFTGTDVAEAQEVCRRHGDLDISLADASIVVLSRRHRCNEVLTLDHRHFRVLRGFDSRPFRILPADQ